MTLRSVLGVDPGKTTGLAMITNHNDKLAVGFTAQIEGRETMYSWLTGVLPTMLPDVIAVESFIITQATARHSRQYDALYIIGAVEMAAQALRIPVDMNPASTKRAWDNARMALHHFQVRGGHAKDAARHALFVYQKRGIVPPIGPDGSSDQEQEDDTHDDG